MVLRSGPGVFGAVLKVSKAKNGHARVGMKCDVVFDLEK